MYIQCTTLSGLGLGFTASFIMINVSAPLEVVVHCVG